MKSLAHLWKIMADELAMWCRTDASLDYKKLESRTKNEGDSFLTITLPSFGKDFERCLDQGRVDSSAFVGFQRRQGPLPLFLGGFLSQVFCPVDGRLLAEPNIDAIFAVRQLTLVFGKIHRPCSDARLESAFDKFVECEQDVIANDADISPVTRSEFREMSLTLWADVFSRLDSDIYYGDVLPKHGPGKTADRLKGNLKYDQREWTQRLEAVFPNTEYLFPSLSGAYLDEHDDVTILEPEAERPVKVVAVPKTLKTPRIIAIEPTCMQYMQQAIALKLIESLRHFGFTEHSLNEETAPVNHVSGHLIGFKDQEENRVLAKEGSVRGHLATLDLSEASDRVSMTHVEDLLWLWPHTLGAVSATRSTKASIPGRGVIPLAKFASMGSALCFPVEAMVFTTIAFLGIQDALSRPLTLEDVESFRGKVRVYGDDIIVPTDYVHHVIARLEAFGLKVNYAKSFWTGKFRESCGGDYYDGTDVTPVRFRRDIPQSRADVQGILSLVEFANHMYLRGMWKTSDAVNHRVRKLLTHFPAVGLRSPLVGMVTFQDPGVQPDLRIHPDYQHPLVKGWAVRSRVPDSVASGTGSLLKCLLKSSVEPFADERHLERQGRPDAVDIKLRWMVPY